MRFCRTMILVGAAALGAGAGVRVGTAQTIHMAGKAVVVGKVVQVGDIGTIDGCDAATAEKLAQMVVVAKFTDSVKVRSEDVLLAVMTQGDPRVGCKVQVRCQCAAIGYPGGALS